MKRGIIKLLLALFFLFLTISFASAYEYNFTTREVYSPEGVNVQVVSYRSDPYPTEPGDQFELWLKVQNIGGEVAKNARCSLILENPFSLYQGNIEENYGSLGTNDFSITTYKIQVDENAIEGENEITVECTADNMWYVKSQKLKIQIQTRYPTLNIINVKTEPSFIEPGQEAQLILTLKNTADSSMKDIDVKLDLSSAPLIPSGEMSEKKIRRLNAGTSDALTFKIRASPDSTGGIYKIPIMISYTDELGKAYSINGTISVEINSKPELEVLVDSTTLTKSNEIGELVLKVVNRGLTDLKFFNMKILPSKQFKIISSDSVYIGDVDSDDLETAEFRIKAGKSKMILPVQIDYKDINNNPYSGQLNVTFNLASASELGVKEGNNWFSIILILAIAYFAYRKREWIFSKIKKLRR